MTNLYVWNMQGANHANQERWSNVKSWFTQDNADIVLLQECGTPPYSAKLSHWQPLATESPISAGALRPGTGAMPGGGGAPVLAVPAPAAAQINCLGITALAGFNNINPAQPQINNTYNWGRNDIVTVLTWKLNVALTVYITYFHWDIAGGRVNLAIVSRAQPANVVLTASRNPGGGLAGAINSERPVLGIEVNNIWYFTIHAISPNGPDRDQLTNIAMAHAAPSPCFIGGDFNHAPNALAGVKNIPPNGHTHNAKGPHGATKTYDWLRWNNSYPAGRTNLNDNDDGVRQDNANSDHYPVRYSLNFT